MNSDELRALQAPSEEKLVKLIELTERYCVVYQTLRNPPAIEVSRRVGR